MADADPKPWFVVAGQWLYDGWNFAQFVSAFTFSAWASQVTGRNWIVPIGPWLFVVAAFGFGFAVVTVIRRVTAYIRIVVHRPTVQIELLSTTLASRLNTRSKRSRRIPSALLNAVSI
jgi:hypothetical protein